MACLARNIGYTVGGSKALLSAAAAATAATAVATSAAGLEPRSHTTVPTFPPLDIVPKGGGPKEVRPADGMLTNDSNIMYLIMHGLWTAKEKIGRGERISYERRLR